MADQPTSAPHLKVRPEHDLRPVGEPLHEGVDGDQQRARTAPSAIVKRLNWIRITNPAMHRTARNMQRLGDADLARRNGPRGGARDAGIVVLVDDVVIGAAGPAHQERAGEEQGQIPGLGIGVPERQLGQRLSPPAREQKQPGADRAIEARQAQIGLPRRGRDAVDPIAGLASGTVRAVPFGGREVTVMVPKLARVSAPRKNQIP